MGEHPTVLPLSDKKQCRQCGHIKIPLKTVKARRASIRNCCGKKGFCRENKGIEKGDASDERELFEDEHLTKPTEPNIFSSDEIVLCENIVENKWKEIMMNDGFSRDWSDRNHFSDGSSKRTDRYKREKALKLLDSA